MLDSPVRKGSDTRERLLALAEEAVLAKGFAATSIEELIAAAGITKSGFFYHFKDKAELARSLLLRYLEHDKQLLDDLFGRADELNEDPLHGFLVGLKLFAEMMENLPEAHPGCLAASFCYQDQLFNQEIRRQNADGILVWRRRFRERLDLIAARYPPRVDVDLDALADMVSTLVEGGIILSRVLHDGTIMPRQIMLYREFVRMVFSPG
jgi:TetR/AcrR family transcriptional repressor of nem operon